MKIKEVVSEAMDATIKTIDDKRAEVDTPMGAITIDRTKPEGAAALMVNPETNEPMLDLTPDVAGAPQQGGEQNPLAAGAKLTVKTDESPEVPYQVKMGPQPMAMTSPSPTAIVASTKWTAITPEIEAKAEAQGFRKVMLKVNGQMVPGLEGGDMKLGSKILVAPSDFQQMSVAGAGTMRRPMGVQSAEKTGIGAPPMKESDDILLDKMLTIAGLR